VRLDLFLKTSRLIRRRATAREMCDAGRVLVNGRDAKPAKEVRLGDVITLRFSTRTVDLEVLSEQALPSKKIQTKDAYRVISETRQAKERDPWNENPSLP
jgi:ribosomal 50S subunit-recycling heat shock protein